MKNATLRIAAYLIMALVFLMALIIAIMENG
jgi:hypothetical protein